MSPTPKSINNMFLGVGSESMLTSSPALRIALLPRADGGRETNPGRGDMEHPTHAFEAPPGASRGHSGY